MTNKRVRDFELISTETNMELLPKRATKGSAGYDLRAKHDCIIAPNTIERVYTGVKAYMPENEVLRVYDRSSNRKKKGIVLVNSVGIIDSDYYNNESNEGEIICQFANVTNETVTIKAGDRIAQGIFGPYYVTDSDDAEGIRTGGIGSTN